MTRININQIQCIENQMLRETIDILNRNQIVFYLAFGSVLGAVRHGGPIPWDGDLDVLVPFPMFEKARICLEKELSDRFMVHGLHNDKKYNLVFPRVAISPHSSDVVHVDIFPLLGLPDSETKQIEIFNRLNKKSEILRFKQFRRYIVNMSFVKNIIGSFIEQFCSPLSGKRLAKQYYDIVKDYPYEEANYVFSGTTCYGRKNILPKAVFGNPIMADYGSLKAPIPEKWDEYLKNYYNDYMKFPPKEEQEKGLAMTFDLNDDDYEKIKDVIGE